MKVPAPILMHGVGVGDVVRVHTSNGPTNDSYLVVDVGLATITVASRRKKHPEMVVSPWAVVIVQKAPAKKVDSFPPK